MKINSASILMLRYLFEESNASILQRRGDITVTAPPDCSLPCLVSVVPQYCESLANVTCVCANADLTLALEGCLYSACNVTDILRVENYKDQTCGVKNDKSHQHQDMRLHIVLTPLVGLFILARVFIRMKVEFGLGLDDWAMVFAGVFYMGSVGIAFPITIMGYGQHTWYLEPSTITLSLKFFYISEFFYGLVLTFTKLSLLLFFRRVFPNRSIQVGTIYVGAFVVASNLSIIVAMLAQCTPVHGNWTNWMYKDPPVKCINSFVPIIFFAAISIFHDVVILILPLPILWGLKLQWKKKAHAMFMFLVGVFVIICSARRLPILLAMKHTMDPSYDQAPVALWSYLEQGVGIICGCLPAFRSLLGHMFPGLRQYLGGSTNASSSNGSGSKPTPYSSAIKAVRSRALGDSSEYDVPGIELRKKGTSEERIIHMGNRSSDESSNFRLVPVDTYGDKIGTRATITAGEANGHRFISCPTKVRHDSRGEISVTQTVHVGKQ